MSEIQLSVDLIAAARRSETLRDRTPDELELGHRRYLRFLELVRRHAGPLAPTRDIDDFWHLHMLHPVAYHRDCLQLFGRILDHDGGFGAVPEERPALGRAFERTSQLWTAAFGDSYVAKSASAENCWHDCQNRCWHDCSSKAFDSEQAGAASA